MIVNVNIYSDTTIKEISNEKGTLTNPTYIANAFNDYFVGVRPTLASRLPVTAGNPIDYISTINLQSMYLMHTDATEIPSIVHQLKRSASQGEDSISSQIVKQCIQYVVIL